MCLLALFFRAVPDAPLVIGANREEVYHRPGEPPQILDGPARAVGGVDRGTGGTWLGVNESGVLVAVTNRLKSAAKAQPRSRGLLVRDLLGCPTAKEAVEAATRELDRGSYAGCNIVCADAERLVVLQGGDWLRVRPLPPGLHVLTNHDVNDASDRRLGHAQWWLEQRPYRTAEDCMMALRQLCAQRGNGDPPMCSHGPTKGTVSSSVVMLTTTLADSQYWHAQGPPCSTPYQDYSHLLRQLAQPRG